MGPETATEYRIFIDGIEFGELRAATAPWDLLEVDSPGMYDYSGFLKSGLKYKNKIDAALGFTHYVKKGKLFRNNC